jgi:hypothetical protein
MLHKPIDYLGLLNDLVDWLIGETMKLAIIYFGWSNWLIVCVTVKEPMKFNSIWSTNWLD